ncbi:hypothetical protein I3760_14G126700 [Carya illinoinensis]|nr:hypothetical protein I3760_14G126700 [Carya illinoinensis]
MQVAPLSLHSQLENIPWKSLPTDPIRRGMAVEDPTAPHGLRLTIKDYPYANDGLILWDSIKQWLTDYVNHYYLDPSLLGSD